MAVELAQASVEQEQEQGQGQQGDLKKQVNGDVAGQEGEEQSQPQQVELELHRACAAGSLEDVRAVLSRGLEQLEILGKSCGYCWQKQKRETRLTFARHEHWMHPYRPCHSRESR